MGEITVGRRSKKERGETKMNKRGWLSLRETEKDIERKE
jgi:hypothetical protein